MLEQNIKNLTEMNRTMQKIEDPQQQLVLLDTVEKLCEDTYSMLNNSFPTSDQKRKMKQVKDIQKKVQQYRERNENKKRRLASTMSSQILVVRFDQNGKQIQQQKQKKMSRQQLSSRVIRIIALEEIKSSQLKVSHEEIQIVAGKMENIYQIKKEIQGLIMEQGEDLQRIESHITETYQKMKATNQQLNEACKLINLSRIAKIRVGVLGIFGTIGWGIFGIPGMIVGLFGGWKVTK